MKLDIIALVVSLLGIAGSIVTFLVYYPTEKRTRKAAARKLELEGDTLSLDYFTKTIEALKKDNQGLDKKFNELKQEFEELKKKMGVKEWIISIYEKASKFCHECPFIPIGEKCPAVEEHERLTK
jgi:predicted RNase H-like nuclease (RuvC/YqgF family)